MPFNMHAPRSYMDDEQGGQVSSTPADAGGPLTAAPTREPPWREAPNWQPRHEDSEDPVCWNAKQAHTHEGSLADSPMTLRSNLPDGRGQGRITTKALRLRTRGRAKAQQPKLRRGMERRLALQGAENVNP